MTEKPEAAKSQEVPVLTLLLEAIGRPLYNPIEISGENPPLQIRALRLYQGRFDDFCPLCGKSTTWAASVSNELLESAKTEQAVLSAMTFNRGPSQSRTKTWTGKFQLNIVCARNALHRADYYFETKGSFPPDPKAPISLVKVGQSPSLTDFQLGNLREFEEGMSKLQRKEYVRAINTSSHGFHVAACVYLRRIFENVLIEARDAYMAEKNMTDWREFREARTDERIRLLRDHLPKFMSEHPQLYGLLSIGVHELTEQQCAEEFPILRQAIALIMRDRVLVAQQAREREEVAKLVAQSVNRHKKT